MSQETIYTCDKCNREQRIGTINFLRSGNYNITFDLCDGCVPELHKWLGLKKRWKKF